MSVSLLAALHHAQKDCVWLCGHCSSQPAAARGMQPLYCRAGLLQRLLRPSRSAWASPLSLRGPCAGTPASAIHEKYCSPKYHCVGHIRAPHQLPDCLFAPADQGVDVPIYAGSPPMPLASASAMQLHSVPGFQGYHGLPGLSKGLIPAFHGH